MQTEGCPLVWHLRFPHLQNVCEAPRLVLQWRSQRTLWREHSRSWGRGCSGCQVTPMCLCRIALWSSTHCLASTPHWASHHNFSLLSLFWLSCCNRPQPSFWCPILWWAPPAQVCGQTPVLDLALVLVSASWARSGFHPGPGGLLLLGWPLSPRGPALCIWPPWASRSVPAWWFQHQEKVVMQWPSVCLSPQPCWVPGQSPRSGLVGRRWQQGWRGHRG